MSFIINKSFFVREIILPNLTSPAEENKLNEFIARYEHQCLLDNLGYPLYKAFGSESSQRMTDLLIGAEYYDGEGELRKWQGLIHGAVQGFSHVYLASVRGDEQIRVGTTPGLVSGESTALFDGSEVSVGVNRPDYRGWNIVPSELTGRGILVKDVDYSWDTATGLFTLLGVNDKFVQGVYYNINFDKKADSLANDIPTTNDVSLIAHYIYFYYQQAIASRSNRTGTSVSKQEAGFSVSPAQKMADAWNFFSDEVYAMTHFLWLKKDGSGVRVYPEFSYHQFLETRRISRRIDSIFSF